MHPASPTPQRTTPAWTRAGLSLLLIFGIVAMINAMVADSPAAADTSSHVMPLQQSSTHTSPAGETAVPMVQSASASVLGVQMSMSECCGLLALCVAMILGIGTLALARSRSTSPGRVLWQLPPPHTFTLGRTLAPLFSSSPLERTAVLRL